MRSAYAILFITVSLATSAYSAAQWNEKSTYIFSPQAAPKLGVYCCIPPEADARTPILIVVPGAKRNAEVYRDAWHELAIANGFIVLSIAMTEKAFPSEYEYNAGGVVTAQGKLVPESQWTLSLIEPLFDDFKHRFGSKREKYSLYGHSAGGQFVLNFLLFKPNSRVELAVAANPAFFPRIDSDEAFPFGLTGVTLPKDAIQRWLDSPVVLLLGDRDLQPRTLPLSNGPKARIQGPHVFSRGLAFYAAALAVAAERGQPLSWKLEVVHNVGHSNDHIVSHAVKYLFSAR